MPDEPDNAEKTKQIKVYVRPSIDEQAEAFARKHRTIQSKSKLTDWALDFYMEMFNRCGGIIDDRGFPVIAEPGLSWGKNQPRREHALQTKEKPYQKPIRGGIQKSKTG